MRKLPYQSSLQLIQRPQLLWNDIGDRKPWRGIQWIRHGPTVPSRLSWNAYQSNIPKPRSGVRWKHGMRRFSEYGNVASRTSVLIIIMCYYQLSIRMIPVIVVIAFLNCFGIMFWVSLEMLMFRNPQGNCFCHSGSCEHSNYAFPFRHFLNVLFSPCSMLFVAFWAGSCYFNFDGISTLLNSNLPFSTVFCNIFVLGLFMWHGSLQLGFI